MSQPKLDIEPLVVGPLMTNCFIVRAEGSDRGVIIDPGDDYRDILAAVENTGITVERILATHCHFDHIAAVAALKRELDAPFLTHEADLSFVEEGKASARRWGFDIEQPPIPDGYLVDGDTLDVGGMTLTVLHTPGHSPGSVSFLHGNQVFAGDVLFQRSIGRTDFRDGSFSELERSIKTRLYTLPDSTVVHTGHGPDTTVGEEKMYNPFVRG